MTKKDYIAIAAALRKARPFIKSKDAYLAGVNCVVGIADAMQADNARFDRSRFMGACYV